MIANPTDQDHLDVPQERQRLEVSLRPLVQQGILTLDWVAGGTLRALQQALHQRAWHLFHFSGHGGFDLQRQVGVLALEDSQGKTALLSAADLARVLTQQPSLRLVVLNACQGAKGSQNDLLAGTAALLASRGIPAVLAMQQEISDQAALELTQGFYDALAAGLPVESAVTEARTVLSMGVVRTLEWVTPVLYLGTADGVLFDLPKQASTRKNAVLIPPGSSPLPPGPAIGGPLCPQCQTPLWVGVRFCYMCGHALLAGTPPASLGTPASGPTAQPAVSPSSPAQPAPSGGSASVQPAAPASSAVTLASPAPITLVPSPAPGVKTTDQWTDEGDHHYKAKRYQEALACYEQAIRIEPRYARALQGKSLAYMYLNHLIDALEAISEAIQLTPKDPTAQYTKGNILMSMHRYDEAALAFEEALTLHPQFSLALLAKSEVLEKGGKHAAALNTLEQFLALNPTDNATRQALQNLVRSLPVGTHLLTLKGSMASWSPDGRRLASATSHNQIHLWDASSGQLLATLKGEAPVAWSPDSRGLASASVGQAHYTVRIWDGSNGQLLATLKDHTDMVLAIAWSPDGRRLASANGDQTVCIWSALSGQLLTTLQGGTPVAWPPDGYPSQW